MERRHGGPLGDLESVHVPKATTRAGPGSAPWPGRWRRPVSYGSRVHFSEYQMRLAAYALIVDTDHPDGDRILLSWWNGEGVGTPGWSLPGGGVEFEEQPTEGVVREVKEETGYDIVVGDPITVHTWSNPDGRPDRPLPFKAVRVLYDATVVGGELGTLEVGGSTDRAAWVPIDQLDDEPGETTSIVRIAVSAHRSRSGAPPSDR